MARGESRIPRDPESHGLPSVAGPGGLPMPLLGPVPKGPCRYYPRLSEGYGSRRCLEERSPSSQRSQNQA